MVQFYKRIKPAIERWRTDDTFKTIASSTVSLGITILFALYNGFLGVQLLSVWHGSICVFYLLLIAIRGMILLTEKKNRTRDERERMRHRRKTAIISSAMLLVLNLSLILPISLMATFEKPVNMGLIPAISIAAHTTYKLTMACVRVQKQKHDRHNVLIAELRTIHFIDALVSILTLQNTLIMVKQDEASVKDMFPLSAVSSAAIYVVILFVTVRFLTTRALVQLPNAS